MDSNVQAPIPLTCVAIDDEPFALEIIKHLVEQFPSLHMVKAFENGISGARFLRENPVDLLFIDINMPDISGLTLVRSLKKKPLIIFTTAHKDFALDGFDLDAVDYLLKPITPDRFSKAIQKAINIYSRNYVLQTDLEECIFVYSEYNLVKILLSEIEYIESLEDYIRLHLTSSKPVITRMPLKKILEKLPEARFKSIHRSYIISVSKVKSISNRKVLLASKKQLPISESYIQFIKEWKNS